MSFLRKIFSDLPPLDLPPEKEEELIEKLARALSKLRINAAVVAYLYMYLPVAPMVNEFTLLPIAPFLEMAGIKGYDYVALLRKRENIRRLIARIEELQERSSWWG